MENYGYDFDSAEAVDLTAEQTHALATDPDFARRVADHQSSLLRRNRGPNFGEATAAGAGGPAEQVGLGTKAPPRAKTEVRSKMYSSLKPGVDLSEIAMGVSATKVRELAPAEAITRLDALCDELGVPETEIDRIGFRFDFIVWLFLNTASGENNQESYIGSYQAVRVIKFFNNDLRPIARFLAAEAETLLRFIREHPEHAMFNAIDSIAEEYGVKHTPWLAFDGIADNPSVKLTTRERTIARSVKERRIARAADQASLGGLDRAIAHDRSSQGNVRY